MMLVDVKVAEQCLDALVNTRASDLFMTDWVAKKLGVLVEKRKMTL